jgi:ABC-type uncharacterized transport system permease subunit
MTINPTRLGMVLLAIFLILYAITAIFSIAVPTLILGIIALIAGTLILVSQ